MKSQLRRIFFSELPIFLVAVQIVRFVVMLLTPSHVLTPNFLYLSILKLKNGVREKSGAREGEKK